MLVVKLLKIEDNGQNLIGSAKMRNIYTFSIICLTIIYSAISFAAEQNIIHLDAIVAIVNDDVITEQELNKATEQVKQQLQLNQTPMPAQAELQQQVLNQLIDKKVELQTAKRAGIEIDNSTVANAIENIAKHNQLTVEELKKKFASEDIDFAEFSKQITEQITVEKLLQREIAPKVTIEKKEIDKYLNSAAYAKQNVAEYHLQDILIALPEVPSSKEIQQAKQVSNKVFAKIKSGENFESIAVALSDAQTALTGGDLDWRRIEEIPTAFTTEIQTLKPGEVAGPIRTANGYHIIKLVDTRGSLAKHYTLETNVRHILLKPNAIKSNKQVKKQLTELRQQIIDGTDFSVVAKKYSQDPGTSIHGGDLDWITPGKLVPPFETAMDKLELAEISQPIQTEFGWHLIQVLDRRKTEDTQAFRETEIRKFLSERHYEEETQNWIKRMRNLSYVEILAQG